MVLKILLGNTGRGGELAIFTSIIKAYRNHFPDAHINVLTADNGVYKSLFQNSPDHNGWDDFKFRNAKGLVNKDPVRAFLDYFAETKDQYDIQEWAGEFDYSPNGTILSNCYKRIKEKRFRLNDIPRKIFIYPTDEELRFAEDTFTKYGSDLVLVAYNTRSANPMMNPQGYQALCDKMAKYRPVAFTSHTNNAALKNHIDLRGISFAAVFALSEKLQYYVGPDTSIPWIVSNMPGKLIVIRGDATYPISNTGVSANGYRVGKKTHEIDFTHDSRPDTIINTILPLVR